MPISCEISFEKEFDVVEKKIFNYPTVVASSKAKDRFSSE